MRRNRGTEESWRDTMEVCRNGHVITTMAEKYPRYRKKRCKECGAETITTCDACGTSIEGTMHIPGVVTTGEKEPPAHCHECGASYPWTNKVGERAPAGQEIELRSPGEINKIFIGHGKSSVWRELKDFLQDRLNLEWEEFNRESAAGLTTTARIEAMLDSSAFAFLVFTAEDTHKDGSSHARENVVHELGLFQGRLGFERAIILLEKGCAEFSNIVGLTQIRFPKGNFNACSEEIRQVLEREGLLP